MKGNQWRDDKDKAKGLRKWSLQQCFLEEYWLCEIAFVKAKKKGLQLLIYDEPLDKKFICKGKIGKLYLRHPVKNYLQAFSRTWESRESKALLTAEWQTGYCPQKEHNGRVLKKEQ